MKYIAASIAASMLYALFFVCIGSKFAADFKQYLVKSYA